MYTCTINWQLYMYMYKSHEIHVHVSREIHVHVEYTVNIILPFVPGGNIHIHVHVTYIYMYTSRDMSTITSYCK